MERINLIKIWEMACKNSKSKKEYVFESPLRLFKMMAFLIRGQYFTLDDKENGGCLRFGYLRQNISHSEYIRLKEVYQGYSEKARIEKEEALRKGEAKKDKELLIKGKIEDEKLLIKEFGYDNLFND